MVSRETSFLHVDRVSKQFGSTVALNNLSLTVEQGEVLSLLGPSGSGKSTLLRVIAGLTDPDSGAVWLRGTEITRKAAYQRGFGMMFQQFALFPHRTVAQNVAFGLEMQGWPAAERRNRVAEMLLLVGLSGYDDRTIFELSGGEQQRVALARSLAPKPSLLLFDEPLGSLDRRLRERLVEELRTILNQVETTAIYVTHDQQEAFTISDRLAVIANGQIMQVGSPTSIYHHPNSRFVAEFFGLTNIVPLNAEPTLDLKGRAVAESPLGGFTLLMEPPYGAKWLVIRPEAATLVDTPSSDKKNIIHGTVLAWSFRGTHYRLVTTHPIVGALEWQIRRTEGINVEVGATVALRIESDGMSFIAG